MREIETLRYEDREELAEATAEAFYDELQSYLEEEEGNVVVSLCGGTSVQDFYKKIPEYSDKISQKDWTRVHFFFSDERMVPIHQQGSNHKLAKDLFLMELGKQQKLLEQNVHTFNGDADDVAAEVKRYSSKLREISNGKVHIPMLGVGGDGHIASLFPDYEQLDVPGRNYLHVKAAPKKPPERVTLPSKVIKESGTPFLFFIGKAKKPPYEKFQDDETDFHDCPAKLARQGEGKTYVVTDLDG